MGFVGKHDFVLGLTRKYLDTQTSLSVSDEQRATYFFFGGSIPRSAVWQVRAMLDQCAASHSVTVSRWALPPSPPLEQPDAGIYISLSSSSYIHPHLFWQSHEFVTHHLLLILYEDDF